MSSNLAEDDYIFSFIIYARAPPFNSPISRCRSRMFHITGKDKISSSTLMDVSGKGSFQSLLDKKDLSAIHDAKNGKGTFDSEYCHGYY